MSRVLVTGGAGFIGSHLCEALLARGDEVSVVDDLSTGRVENIAHLQDREDFHMTVGSVLDAARLEPLVRKTDVIFHLAAVVGVQKIINAPVETIETNVLGSHNVLSQAARYGKLCLIASTSEVYGKSNKVQFTEDDDVVYGPNINNSWSNDRSKTTDILQALSYYSTHALPDVLA